MLEVRLNPFYIPDVLISLKMILLLRLGDEKKGKKDKERKEIVESYLIYLTAFKSLKRDVGSTGNGVPPLSMNCKRISRLAVIFSKITFV